MEQSRKPQWKRIEAIIGDNEDKTFEEQRDAFSEHLVQCLELPCEVAGIEDFRWEEPYVLGGWNPAEYELLRKESPSYQEKYDLLAIKNGVFSEWMLFDGDDIGAHVRRKSDGKKFWLGLSEVKGVAKKSSIAQLLHDFSVCLVNSR